MRRLRSRQGGGSDDLVRLGGVGYFLLPLAAQRCRRGSGGADDCALAVRLSVMDIYCSSHAGRTCCFKGMD
jgi:hypothetical protein